MTAEAIVSVSAAVVALTQLSKWSGLPDRWGAVAVLLLAGVGVGVWIYSQGTFQRGDAFALFAGWIAVATSAAGVFGFTRTAADAVTATRTPPAGAAQSPTTKAP